MWVKWGWGYLLFIRAESISIRTSQTESKIERKGAIREIERVDELVKRILRIMMLSTAFFPQFFKGRETWIDGGKCIMFWQALPKGGIHLSLSAPDLSWVNCSSREHHPGATRVVAHRLLLLSTTSELHKLSFQVIPASALLMGGSPRETLDVLASIQNSHAGRQGWCFTIG